MDVGAPRMRAITSDHHHSIPTKVQQDDVVGIQEQNRIDIKHHREGSPTETKRFTKFQENIKSPVGTEVKGIMDIEQDIEDLRQAKDIREELGIMSSLFHIQKEVLQVMDHAFKDERALANRPGLIPSDTSPSPKSATSAPVMSFEERVFHSPMLAAIQQLLDLKHKQANLLEERLTRQLSKETSELTSQILDLNTETSSQGKTIIYFTIATIFFVRSIPQSIPEKKFSKHFTATTFVHGVVPGAGGIRLSLVKRQAIIVFCASNSL
ncbi:hypothetical protein AK830_g2646 [Neonectria ditissima]|uniref:Uncharacterized protein n=1 Tax=Neonectria ditissima TaxID=78410 RepID=A0A0P7BJU2_9HYPO|nr:hypothetical protein AK830_g2646 [Neonectria ditissima]